MEFNSQQENTHSSEMYHYKNLMEFRKVFLYLRVSRKIPIDHKMNLYINRLLNTQGPKLLTYIVLIAVGSLAASCQSDTERNNEILNAAIQASQTLNNSPANDSVQLPIQNSTYTDAVKKAPTQEELIVKHKVKSARQVYEGGWSIATYDKKGK